MSDEKIIPNKDNIRLFDDVKFLIENEDMIDWEHFSTIKERSLSIPEIKLFGKKIPWTIYVYNHEMNEDEISVAEKYFKDTHTFKILCRQQLSETFVKKHADKLFWPDLLENSSLSEDFIFDMIEHWSKYKIEEIKKAIVKSKYINVNFYGYEKLLLYLKLI
jgi:hypothetical protein